MVKMNCIVEVIRDERAQRSIPTEWRATIGAIVDGLISGDSGPMSIPNVGVVSSERRARIADNIDDYGAQPVASLEESWDTSVCQWMGGYWDALIDLFTEEGRSDLVLSLRVKEEGGYYLFEVMSVHVP